MSDVRFVGCEGGERSDAQAIATVHASGRPRRIIDVHAHCAIPAAMALAGAPPIPVAVAGLNDSGDDVATRLAAMDAHGVDLQVLSINPFWYAADQDLSRQVVDLQNEALAELVGRSPDRFAALAAVALQHPDLAAEQLERAVKRLGLRGALVGGSVEGEELSDPRFRPFWAKAEDLGAVIFIHPQATPDLRARLRGSGGLPVTLGYPLETTIALAHLIFEGTLDRFPGLKICVAHGGGFLPAYAGRFDAGIATFPSSYTVKLKKPPSAYLRDLYYDSLLFTPEGLRHLIAEVGADRVMVGSDWPFPWTDRPVQHVLETPGLTDAERAAILGDTAARLFGLNG